MWNPAFSSYTWERFKTDQEDMCDHEWGPGVGNWNVWEHDKVEGGDRFFMVKVGEGKTGIVMAGYFDSMPYEDEDWSGRGRQTFYVDLDICEQLDADKVDIITTETLQAKLPNFDWTGGHSGRVLDAESAEKLELMWLKYFNKIRLNIFNDNAIYTADSEYHFNKILEDYFRRTRGETCEICGYNYKRIFGDTCEEYVSHDLYLTQEDKSQPLTDADFLNRVRCVCPSCQNAGKKVFYKKLY